MSYISDQDIEKIQKIYQSEYHRYNAAIQIFLCREQNPSFLVEDLDEFRKNGFRLNTLTRRKYKMNKKKKIEETAESLFHHDLETDPEMKKHLRIAGTKDWDDLKKNKDGADDMETYRDMAEEFLGYKKPEPSTETASDYKVPDNIVSGSF